MVAIKKVERNRDIEARAILKKFEELKSLQNQIAAYEKAEEELGGLGQYKTRVDTGVDIVSRWNLQEVDKVLSMLISQQEEILSSYEFVEQDIAVVQEMIKQENLIRELNETMLKVTRDPCFAEDIQTQMNEQVEQDKFSNSMSVMEFCEKTRLSMTQYQEYRDKGELDFAQDIKGEKRFFIGDTITFIANRLLAGDPVFLQNFSGAERDEFMTFDNHILLNFSYDSIKEALDEVEDTTIATALTSADTLIFDHIMLMISFTDQQRAMHIRKMIESAGPQRVHDVRDSQREILLRVAEQARKR